MSDPLVIALLDRKEDGGKTTMCYYLAGVFARDGRRVLLVDMNPGHAQAKVV